MDIQYKLLTPTAKAPTKHMDDDAGIDIFSDITYDILPN
jgi:hypothetical protein